MKLWRKQDAGLGEEGEGAPEVGTERTKKSSRSRGKPYQLRGKGKDTEMSTEWEWTRGGKQKKRAVV